MSVQSRLVRLHQWLIPCHHELGITPYFWLIYLAFPVTPLFFREMQPEQTLMTILVICAFVPMYFRAFALSGPALLHYCAAMVVLGCILAPFNNMANVFFVYAASFAPYIGSTRTTLGLIAAINAALLTIWYAFDLSIFFSAIGVLLVVMIGGSNLVVERKNRELRKSRAEAERLAAVAERERIARDLHDLLGHSLSMITLKSELAARLVDSDPERARREIREVEAESRRALADVRRTVTGYRHADLQQELATATAAFAAANIGADIQDAPRGLAGPVELTLAMALREAVTNVIRHAEAQTCRVVFDLSDEHVELIVTDDGNGKAGREGSGLNGMRERSAAVGGRLARESMPDTGTRLTVRLPLRATDGMSATDLIESNA